MGRVHELVSYGGVVRVDKLVHCHSVGRADNLMHCGIRRADKLMDDGVE